MNIKSINSISFSDKTDDGNDYKTTNSGKTSGALGGAILGGLGCYSDSKKNTFGALLHESKFKNKAQYVAFYCALYSVIGLICGALVDILVNSNRAVKVDNKSYENPSDTLNNK